MALSPLTRAAAWVLLATAACRATAPAATAQQPSPAAPKGVRFIAVGDTGRGNAEQHQVAAAMKAKCAASGCDLVVMLGDNFYPTGVTSPEDAQFQEKFEQPYAGLDIPFYPVLGNHDYGGNGAGDEFGKGAHEVAYTGRSYRWKMPAPHHHFQVENVEFFATDTNMQLYGQDGVQRRDMAQWLAASTAAWKISLGHHPYLSNGYHGNAGSYDGKAGHAPWDGVGVKSFFEEVLCGRVDLALFGHDHNRQWLEPTCRGTELVVSGAGAGGSALKQTNPARFQSSAVGFLWVEVEGGKLTGEFIGPDGAVDFVRTLTRP
ncbi:MAG: metallophosphoesterase [Deltaproteobacteria bacterium]|nr:metallophosphoesterase [Deltaproteobacteria bacterium]